MSHNSLSTCWICGYTCKTPIIAHIALEQGTWCWLLTAARYIALSLISRYLSLDPYNRDISGLHCIWIPMLKIRRSRDRLIFNMGIPIPGKDEVYIETGPRTPWEFSGLWPYWSGLGITMMNWFTKYDINPWAVCSKCANTTKVWQMNRQMDIWISSLPLFQPCWVGV